MTVFVGCPEGCRFHTALAVYDLVLYILRAIVHGFGRDVSLSRKINELIYANVVIFISSTKRFVQRSI